MSMPHCDTRPNQRQYASVFAGIYTPTYRSPMDMRSLLKALMALRDENAYGLESRSGVPRRPSTASSPGSTETRARRPCESWRAPTA
jgi:hypothetical protein